MEFIVGIMLCALFVRGVVLLLKFTMSSVSKAGKDVASLFPKRQHKPKVIYRDPQPPSEPVIVETPEERYRKQLAKIANLPLDEDELIVVTEELRQEFIRDSMR